MKKANEKTAECSPEELFCLLCAEGMDADVAAAKAGFKGECSGEKLLTDKKMRARVRKLRCETKNTDTVAADTLRKLMSPPSADAVRLLLCLAGQRELGDSELCSLDLCGISEIKVQKGGGAEIKFADRIEAAQVFSTLAASGENKATPLLNAILAGARAVNSGTDDAV